MNDTEIKVGDAIIFVDAEGKAHPALVEAVWPQEYPDSGEPGINCIHISDDENSQDVVGDNTFGRGLVRATSIVHKKGQPANGNYWYRLNEAPDAAKDEAEAAAPPTPPTPPKPEVSNEEAKKEEGAAPAPIAADPPRQPQR